MKNHIFRSLPFTFGVALVALLSLTSCNKKATENSATTSAAAPAESPAAASAVGAMTPSPSTVPATPPFAGGRKTSFQEVTAQLDPGGSLFLYMATDQWLAELSTKVGQFAQMLSSMPGGERGEEVGHVFEVFTRLIKASGVEEISGVGLSAAPVAPGLYRNKLIAHHPSGRDEGFVWSLFGNAAHALTGQTMLPTNTALAIFSDLNVEVLWQTVKRELEQSQIPNAREMARNWPQMFEKQMQLPWADLLGCVGGEIGLVLTLDENQTIDVPLGDGRAPRLSLPAPGLVLAVKINNGVLYDRLSTEMQRNPQVVRVDEPGLKMCSLPTPAPFPLELTVANAGDYLFLASSPELVRTVQAVRQGKQRGLKETAEFAAMAKHLPAEGNQFMYVAQTFGTTFADLQQQVLRGTGLPPQQFEMMQSLLGAAGSSYSLAIGAHTTTGWRLSSVGNKDSASAAVFLPTIGVTAVGAGLLLPALAKAKAKAQSISTVSNLKQLGLAARMYSNDHQDTFPKSGSWCDDLKTYTGNPKVYQAPNDPRPRPCSFAYNAKLSEIKEAKINPETVLFFETDEGQWNQSGGSEMLIAHPRAGGPFVIGFADGSVRMIPPDRLSSLRWDP